MDSTQPRPESPAPQPTRILPSDATQVLPADETDTQPTAASDESRRSPEAPTVVITAATQGSDPPSMPDRPPAAPMSDRPSAAPTVTTRPPAAPTSDRPAPTVTGQPPATPSMAPRPPTATQALGGPPSHPADIDDERVVDGELEPPAELPVGLLTRMKADPTHAPEYLAVAAVEKFGPEAALWMARTRAAHPYVADHVWVPVILTRFVRISRYSGAAAGVTGAVGAVVDVGVLAWNQARMVLHIAAALGYDPTHPDRAAELLLLRGIQTKLDAARTAIDVVRRQQDPSALAKHFSSAGKAYSVLAWQLARMAGMAAVKRFAMKAIPFAGVPLGAIANAGATKKLAEDAVNYYSRRRQPPALPPGRPS